MSTDEKGTILLKKGCQKIGDDSVTSFMLEVKNLSNSKEGRRYSSIDMEKTGILLKSKLESAGYTPRMIQEYLHLSCPQPVYRWFKGMILPSVDHLLMLSELLDEHMEELLVKKQKRSCEMVIDFDKYSHEAVYLVEYYNKIRSVA